MAILDPSCLPMEGDPKKTVFSEALSFSIPWKTLKISIQPWNIHKSLVCYSTSWWLNSPTPFETYACNRQIGFIFPKVWGENQQDYLKPPSRVPWMSIPKSLLTSPLEPNLPSLHQRFFIATMQCSLGVRRKGWWSYPGCSISLYLRVV